MTVIQEGALKFTFKPDTQACRYDTWSFYRNQFQNGCSRENKAVDFLCHSKECAWLIEVKDFRHHERTKVVELPDEIANKVRDTLAGLVAAQVNANDESEKKNAHAILRKKQVRVVCHIEQPSKSSRLRPRAIEPDKLQLKLRSLLKAIDAHPTVMDRKSAVPQVPWRVT